MRWRVFGPLLFLPGDRRNVMYYFFSHYHYVLCVLLRALNSCSLETWLQRRGLRTEKKNIYIPFIL